jgi:hypothetical protein
MTPYLNLINSKYNGFQNKHKISTPQQLQNSKKSQVTTINKPLVNIPNIMSNYPMKQFSQTTTSFLPSNHLFDSKHEKMQHTKFPSNGIKL